MEFIYDFESIVLTPGRFGLFTRIIWELGNKGISINGLELPDDIGGILEQLTAEERGLC